jgi:hypothetical protein
MLTVMEETPLLVRTTEPVSSRSAHEGQPLLFSVSEDVCVDAVLAIPRGALVHGVVVSRRKPGVLTGSPDLVFKLTALEFEGRSYPILSYQFKVTGTSKTRPTEKKAVTGAAVGTVVGSFAGGASKSGVVQPANRAANMAAGAAVGAGVGALASAASPGPAVIVPSEAQIEFVLASPVTVPAASPALAQRIARSAHSSEPVLYVRGETP